MRIQYNLFLKVEAALIDDCLYYLMMMIAFIYTLGEIM